MKKLSFLVIVMLILSACASTTTETVSGSSGEIETTTQVTEVQAVEAGALLANINARKALAQAVDKEFIAEVILANGSTATDYLVPEGLDYHYQQNRKSAPYHYDIEAAKASWQEAQKELSFNQAEITLLTYDSEGAKKIANFLKKSLEENLSGLTIRIKSLPFKEKNEAALKGEYDIELTGWAAEVPSASDFTNRFSKEEDTAFAEETLLQEVSLIPLYNKGVLYLQNSKVEGLAEHSFGASLDFREASVKKDGDKNIDIAVALDITSLDNSKYLERTSLIAANAIYEGLTTIDSDGKAKLAGALSYDLSTDGKIYTFKLRPDAKYSDGSTIIANDYLTAFRRLASLRDAGKNSNIIVKAGVKNAQAVIDSRTAVERLGVKVIDEKTLQIELDRANDHFLEELALPAFAPMKQNMIDTYGQRFGTKVNTVLSSGPFQLNDWQKGYSFSLSKNPNYWNKTAIAIDRINFLIIADAQKALESFEKGEIDRSYLAGKTAEHKDAQKQSQAVTYFLKIKNR